MLANISERDRKTLRLGGIGVVVILLLVFVGFPLMDRLEKAAQRAENARKEMRAIEASVTGAAEATQAMNRLRDHATTYSDRLELNEQTPRMLQQVGAVPGYSAIRVERLEALPLRNEDTYYRSAVSLQFSGTLRDLHRFLRGVEESKPSLVVEQLTLSAAAKDTSKVSGQMVIAGYAVVGKKGA
jgi:Tfp pilus assembly protein PilO